MLADASRARAGTEPADALRRPSGWGGMPWWSRALAVWALSRLVTTALLAVAAIVQGAIDGTGAPLSLGAISTMWDARWYREIAIAGYPTQLPRDSAGTVIDNAWAFLPVYPMLLRGLLALGVPWQAAAIGISLAASAVVALLLHRLLAPTLGDRTTFAVALVLASPASPVLQLGYAESLHLALLVGALLAIRERAWLLVVGLVPLMALTRPSGVAFALAIAILAAIRWRRAPAERGWLVGLASWALAWGLAWPLWAGFRTGEPGAYLATELHWRVAYVGGTPFLPGSGWVAGAQWWLGGSGLALLALGVGALAWLLADARIRRAMGQEGWAWTVAYLLYLLAVWFPQTSTARILLPAFALVAAIAIVPRRWWWPIALALAVAGQGWWLASCWITSPDDWTIP